MGPLLILIACLSPATLGHGQTTAPALHQSDSRHPSLHHTTAADNDPLTDQGHLLPSNNNDSKATSDPGVPPPHHAHFAAFHPPVPAHPSSVAPADKRFLKGVDAYLKAGKRDDPATERLPADKRFIKGVDAYIKAGKRQDTELHTPDKKFMRGIDAYIKAGKRGDEVENISADKKFMRGVDAYLKAGKRDDTEIQTPDKKFMRGIDAYIKAGKRDDTEIQTPDKKFMRGIDAYMKAGKREDDTEIQTPDKKFMRGIDAYIKADKRDDTEIQTPDKKFMRGIDAYIKADKRDDTEIQTPDKKFMRGVDAYIKAGKRDGTEIQTPDKKFMRGVDAYIKAGKRDDAEIQTPDKKFMRGVDAYIKAGKREDETSTISADKKFMRGVDAGKRVDVLENLSANKKFMRGVDAYIKSGKRYVDTDLQSDGDLTADKSFSQGAGAHVPGKGVQDYHNMLSVTARAVEGKFATTGNEDTETGETNQQNYAISADKKFMRGIDSYFQSGKRDALGVPDKKFMRGIDAYFQSGKRNTLDIPDKKFMRGIDAYFQSGKRDTLDVPDKKFMRGIDAYFQSGERNALDVPDKKFMRGIDAYFQPRKSDTLDVPDKKFMRGIDAYFQTGKSDTLDVPNKKFMRGIDAYFQSGKRDTLDAPNKKFMRGIDAYFQPGKRDKLDVPDKKFKRGIDAYFQSVKGDTLDVPDKRFMRGIDAYIKGKRFIKGIYFDSNSKGNFLESDLDRGSGGNDKRFMRGVDLYLQGQGKRQAGPDTDPQGAGVDREKRVVTGTSPGPHAATDKQDGDELDQSGDAQGLKGAGLAKRRVKRAGSTDHYGDGGLSADKRFLKGLSPHFRRLYALGFPASKRFMRLPYVYVSRQPWADDKRGDADLDPEDPVTADKRFMKGVSPYLSAYMSRQYTKRFLKGVDPYLRSYSSGYGQSAGGRPSLAKRFLKGVDPYLQLYVNRWQDKRLGQSPLHKRFMRFSDPFFSLRHGLGDEAADREDDVGNTPPLDPAPRKRFMKGIDDYLRAYSSTGPSSKRFIKNYEYFVQLQNRLRQQESQAAPPTPAKRFLRGMDLYFRGAAQPDSFGLFHDTAPSRDKEGSVDGLAVSKRSSPGDSPPLDDPAADKRLLKGVDPYLQSYSGRAGQRPRVDTPRDQPRPQGASGGSDTSGGAKRSRRSASSDYFGLYHVDGRPGAQGKRAVDSPPRDSLQNFVGDTLVLELAKSALEDAGGRPRSDHDILYSRQDARLSQPEMGPMQDPSASRWGTLTYPPLTW